MALNGRKISFCFPVGGAGGGWRVVAGTFASFVGVGISITTSNPPAVDVGASWPPPKRSCLQAARREEAAAQVEEGVVRTKSLK